MSGPKYVAVGTAADTTLTITRQPTETETEIVQGLVLEAEDELRVGGHTATRVVLWADTAPTQVEVVTGAAGELRMWNVWRDGDLIQAWENDARLDVDDEGDDLGLSCHDGHPGGGPGLVVRIAFDRAWTQPDVD